VFRRKPSTDAAAAAAAEQAALAAAGKGRPTPSRKEAEAARKERAKPQLDKRAAARATREQQRLDRAKARASLASGDERYLPARDKGPVRAYARDWVDTRRSLGEFMLPLIVVFLVISFINNTALRGYAIIAFYAFMLALIVSTTVNALRLRRAVEAAFPDESSKGVGLYGAMRSMQLRRMRLPKPKVPPGGTPA
jgi:Flp pilus assembly protein TadB